MDGKDIELENGCKVIEGNSLDVLPTFADAMFDAVVCDPPYELGFMGKAWDKSGIAYRVDLWREVFRVMKPGAHLLAFGGSRTYHRLACAIEDAGFEIRDQIQWIYGSGFPKSLDVSKAIDKAAGAERFDAIKGGHMAAAGRSHGIESINGGGLAIETSIPSVINKGALTRGTAATDAAKTWDGWGTALKPAHEPIVMARRPLEKGLTVAQNVLKWGTGAINIDKCRIETDDILTGSGTPPLSYCGANSRPFHENAVPLGMNQKDGGRFPANVIHDGSDEVLAGFPEAGGGFGVRGKGRTVFGSGLDNETGMIVGYGDEGSAARFFYSPKASKYDREAGLREAARPTMGNGIGGQPDQQIENNRNIHPTVKPTDLMQYLCRLVTPPGGLILDPFLGSGSTMKAALVERFRCIGIELNPEYAEIARARLNSLQVKLF